jgi:hypothetical protein
LLHRLQNAGQPASGRELENRVVRRAKTAIAVGLYKDVPSACTKMPQGCPRPGMATVVTAASRDAEHDCQLETLPFLDFKLMWGFENGREALYQSFFTSRVIIL